MIYKDFSAGSMGASGSLTAEGMRTRVDRDTVSDREWLALLDDRVNSTIEWLDRVDQRPIADRQAFEERIEEQADELRQHVLSITRQGWQFILLGAC